MIDHPTTPRTHDIGHGASLPDASVSPDRRRTMIAEAAYFRAQSRGFAPGGELDDWLEAEWSVDEFLAEREYVTLDARD